MTPDRLARAVRWLLRRHADPFIRQHETDFLEVFHTRAAAARGAGRWPWWRFAVRELTALSLSACRERIRRFDLAPGVVTRELRHALRRLAAARSFALSATGILAVTLAALAVVFTLVHRIVLAPLPYQAADRLIDLDHAAPGVGISGDLGMSIGLYHQYATLGSVESLAIYYVGERTFSGTGDAANTEFLHTTRSLSRVLNVQPTLGRWFTEAEGAPGGAKVIVLTDSFWRRQFGAAPGVIGTIVRVDGVPHEVIGVMPRGFAFPDPRVEFIAPLPVPPRAERAAGFNYSGIARLTGGTTMEQARQDQTAVIADLANRYPADPDLASGMLAKSRLAAIPAPMKDRILGDIASPLWILLGACAMVLLMACANLANLFLVRAESQRTDVALRRALGADALALGAYRLSEAAVIVIMAAGIALVLAHGALRLLHTGAVSLPRLHEVRIDGTVGLFVAGAAAVIWLLLAASSLLQPALSRQGLHVTERRTTASVPAVRVRQLLIATQIALALVLLSSAGLLARSLSHLMHADPGVRTDARLVFRIGLPGSSFRDRRTAAEWHERMLERLGTIHGVRAVGAGSSLPLTGDSHKDPIEVFGRPMSAGSLPVVRFARVSPGFFDALAIPLRQGRTFDGADARGTSDSVLVNDALVRHYFPGEDPLGRRIRPYGTEGDRWLTIVGVVGNTATEGVQEPEALPKLYVPFKGSFWADVPSPHDMSYVVQTDGAPLAAAPQVRELLRRSNPELAVAGMERYSDIVARSRANVSFTMVLVGAAATIALLLGIVGVYAVVAYSVALRRTEIAVRLAVGATPRQVTREQLRQGSVPIVLGLGVGIGAALAASRALQALLFGVGPRDPATYAAAAGVLLVVAVASCWWPARRAAYASPLDALR